jgi:hypothetical protein
MVVIGQLRDCPAAGLEGRKPDCYAFGSGSKQAASFVFVRRRCLRSWAVDFPFMAPIAPCNCSDEFPVILPGKRLERCSYHGGL